MRRAWPLVVFLLLLVAAGAVRYRIGTAWVFAGADSYGYIKVAEEWRQHGRYALGPPPEPLYYGRPPGYPLLLRAFIADDQPEWYRKKSDNWKRIQHGQSLLELFTLPALIYWLIRRKRGPLAALAGVALVSFWPLTVTLSNIVLTELLAMLLSSATIALLLVDGRDRWRFGAAGLFAGMAFLVRADSALLLAPFIAALFLVDGNKARCTAALCALVGGLVIVGPWALRNLVQFGAPHLVVVGLDRESRPLDTSGFRDWMSTWAEGEHELSQFEFCYNSRGCGLDAGSFPPVAFGGSDAQRLQVRQLLERRARNESAEQVSRGFGEVARQRRRQEPLRTRLTLPLWRAFVLWRTSPEGILLNPNWRPWPQVFTPLIPLFKPLTRSFAVATWLALAVLLLFRHTRRWGIVLAAAIAFRTLVLAYFYYPEPRYLFEIAPMAMVAIVLAAAELAAAARSRLRRQRPSTAR